MALKLGNVAIALIIFTFIVTGFSSFINNADSTTGLNSGIVGSSMTSLANNLSGTKDLEEQYTDKTDATGEFVLGSDVQQLEDRGSDTGSIVNVLSKNIIINFIKEANEHIPGFSEVFGFMITLVSVTISILLLRFFWGEGKI